MKATYVGGPLSFKGDKKAKKKRKTAKHALVPRSGALSGETPVTANNAIVSDDLEVDLTEAERKALKRKKERERQELEKVAQKSHRERVEEFNEKLASVTEHNDIPRVSAAGNG